MNTLNRTPEVAASPTPGREAPATAAEFTVPARHNPLLQALVERINADEELWQLWRCANVNVVDRLGMTDHGEVHVRIVANAALRLLRLLRDSGHTPGVVAQHGLTPENAEVIVVLAAALHDLGLSIHRENHEEFSGGLAHLKARELLSDLYSLRERTILVSEVLHAVIAHHGEMRCLTLEAGALKVADALDMTKGRSRIPFEAGSSSIHAVSAAAIDVVTIKKGETRPVRVEVRMSNSAGIFQVNELLRRKLEQSTLAGLIEVVARVEGESEKRLIPLYTLEGS